MRLFLSSYRFGDYGDVLREMIDEDAKVGMITNAKDYKTDAERAESVTAALDSFKELDIEPQEIDLRPFFDQPELLGYELDKYNVIWLAGGNTFVLARALKASGADEVVQALVAKDRILYGGESAGAVIAGPSLLGAEFADDPEIIPAGYTDEDVWKGLGLIPYMVVPHYESGLEAIDRMVDTLEEAGRPYKTLNDQQVIIVNGDEAALLQ